MGERWPNVLGALLTLAAAVHHRLPSITVLICRGWPTTPKGCGRRQISAQRLKRYLQHVQRSPPHTFDTAFIGALINRRYSCKDKASKEILADLTPTDEKWKPPKYWPDNARAVTGQLTRHATALRAQGWMIDNDDAANKDSVIRWTILPPTDPEKAGKSSPPSPPNPPEADNGWSDGLWTRNARTGTWGYDEHANPPDPPNDTPLTSQDGLAGMAGMEYTPSQSSARTAETRFPSTCRSPGPAATAPKDAASQQIGKGPAGDRRPVRSPRRHPRRHLHLRADDRRTPQGVGARLPQIVGTRIYTSG